MRILTIVRRFYYGCPAACEPLSVYFTAPLRRMGHSVDTFDHFEAAARWGRLRATDRLIRKIRTGDYQVVLYQTHPAEPVQTARFGELRERHLILAWNSDDDWQWAAHSRHISGHFTYMVTTYRRVYEENKAAHPNLLLSQWGCFEGLVSPAAQKDLDFTFVGRLYGPRLSQCRWLAKRAGLVVFGEGRPLFGLGIPWFPGAFRIAWLRGRPLPFEEVHRIWSRSRISYAPMESASSSRSLQVKARAFEMGLSGTVMITRRNPNLEQFYDPGVEYLDYDDLAECADKVAYYSRQPGALARIAARYEQRTRSQHLWRHRFEELFRTIGVD